MCVLILSIPLVTIEAVFSYKHTLKMTLNKVISILITITAASSKLKTTNKTNISTRKRIRT